MLTALPFFAQTQDLRFSILTGPSFSSMSANNNKINGTGSKIAFKAHVIGEYWFTDRYAATLGIGLAVSQGGSMEYSKGGDLWKDVQFDDPAYHTLPPDATLTYRMNYLEIPFGLKLRTNEFGKFRFYVHAPEFTIGLRTKARGDIDAPPLLSSEGEDIREMIPFLSLFYAIGIGTEYKISSDVSLLGGLRYYQSFTDITIDSGRYSDGSKEDSKGILSSFDLRVGVTF